MLIPWRVLQIHAIGPTCSELFAEPNIVSDYLVMTWTIRATSSKQTKIASWKLDEWRITWIGDMILALYRTGKSFESDLHRGPYIAMIVQTNRRVARG